MYYDTQRKLALFDYQPGRGALYPKAMLHKFKGYLQTDGYDAYETFDKVEGVTLLLLGACAQKILRSQRLRQSQCGCGFEPDTGFI
ncbi:MAG: transposase [Sphingobacteriales bacterium]|nr:transposase [Sphingobacteriales bacterium]